MISVDMHRVETHKLGKLVPSQEQKGQCPAPPAG